MIKVRNTVGLILVAILGGLILNTVDPSFITRVKGHQAVYKDESEEKRKRYEVRVEYHGKPAHVVSITVMIAADVTDVRPNYRDASFERDYHNRRAGDKITFVVIAEA